ncbi:MAG: hypothetical protein P4L83_12520 [Nevskia sp.]|nr:hypothetical protein [Nevskia sp.]
MTKNSNKVLMAATLLAAGAGFATALCASAADIDAGTAETKKLLLLMDTDKSGKVSKQEFMSYMEAEFARLDVNKDGELDVKELTALRVRTNNGPHK